MNNPVRGSGSRAASQGECLLEQVAPAEYPVHDASGPLDALRALAGMGVRHRLEVYAADDSPAACLHHQYPQAAGVPLR